MNLSTLFLFAEFGQGKKLITMPRKNPLPQREIEICRRLREFRKYLNLSQVAFAREVGMDSTKLASYEHARAPLRYQDAYKILSYYLINPKWLASGTLPIMIPRHSQKNFLFKTDTDAPFSDTFDRAIAPSLAGQQKQGSKSKEFVSGGYDVPISAVGRCAAIDMIQHDIESWFEEVPDARLNDFLNKLYQFGEGYIHETSSDSQKNIEKRKREMAAVRASLQARATKFNKK